MKSVLFFLLILSFPLKGQDVLFSDLSAMEIGRSAINSASNGENIFVANGFTTMENYSTEVLKYSVSSDTWTSLPNFTILKRFPSLAIIDNKLYIFNGKTPTGINQEVEVIDLSDNSYTLSTTNPNPGSAAGAAVWEGKIYSFGGSIDGTQFSNKLSVFDPVEETWTTLADMPLSLETKGEIVDGKLYVFGGYNGSVSDQVLKYDIATDTWTFIGLMPYGISAHATTVIGNQIWLAGDFVNHTSLLYFDVLEEKFYTQTSNMKPRRHAAAEGINGQLYLIGGNTASDITTAIPSTQVSGVLTSSGSSALEKPFVIFPNPSSDYLIFEKEMEEVKVFDLFGRLIEFNNTPSSKMHLEKIEPGIYVLIGQKDGVIFRGKFEKL